MRSSTAQRQAKFGAADMATGFRRSFGQRFEALLNRFESRVAASKVALVDKDQFPKYVDGRSKPPMEVVVRLALAKGVSLDWLATGEGEPDRAPPPAADDGEFAFIPVWTAEASSGFGTFVDVGEIGDRLAFSRHWLRTTRASAEKNLCVVFNRGDSNEPDIRHGDAMLVDRGVQALKENAFYVFDREGMLLVKAIERSIDGDVILRSRNPRYSDQTLSPEEAANITVFGRVLWRGGLL